MLAMSENVVEKGARPFFCSFTNGSPRQSFCFKIPEYLDGEKTEHFRTIDFCLKRQVFRGSEEGSDVAGKVHWLTEDELSDLKESVGNKVVRWKERPNPLSGRTGIGPGGRFARADVFDKTHRKYRRQRNDEPLERYIAIRPLTESEFDAYNSVGNPEKGGFGNIERELDRVKAAEAGVKTASLDAEWEAIEAAREAIAKERAALEAAKKAEAQALSEPGGVIEKERQSQQKRRGRPPKNS